KADFALSTGGAKIISPLTSPTYEQWPTQWYKMAFAKLTGHGITRGKPPVTALQPDVHVGQCWPFAGQKGQLAVLLSRQIYVTAVTYDHVSKTIAMGTTSAPKEFEIWGFADDEQDKDNFDNEHSEHTNTVNRLNKPVKAIIMKVINNWDNPLYTCLYRFRVHG
ncbi:UNC-like C-terminal-domain-containing protein, partial [Rhizophagus diaphanus]